MTLSNTVDQIKAPPRPESGMSQADCSNAVEKLARTIGQLPINPTAKLVAFVMRTSRVTDTKTLAEMLGLSMRVVQRSKNEFADTGDISDTGDTYVATPTNPATPTSLSPAPRVHAPAQMEYPTDINIPQEVASSTPEIEGLNGSTEYFTDMLAGWLAGSMSVPDTETSHKLLVGYVNAYSPEAVKSGMVELETEIAQGRLPRDVGKAFSGFVRKAHERGSKPGNVVPLAVPDWRQEKADRIERTRKLRAEWRQEHAL
jgi:hypothetical protein